jgi:hypothetical protein
MENPNPVEERLEEQRGDPLVPPVVDEAELIGAPAAAANAMEEETAEQPNPPLDTAEQQHLVLDSANAVPQQDSNGARRPARPGLRREGSVPTPAPLHLPPPAPIAPPPEVEQATDSLSLQQLRSLVGHLGKTDHAPYAFTYDDASSFEDELEEWFSYSVEEQAMLLKTCTSFSSEWPAFIEKTGDNSDWNEAGQQHQKEFIQLLLGGIKQTDPASRLQNLEALVYVLLGCWHDTAGMPCPNAGHEPASQESADSNNGDSHSSGYEKSGLQVHLIRNDVRLLVDCDGLQALLDVLRSSFARACDPDVVTPASHNSKEAERRELWAVMTAVYVILEVARIEEKEKGNLSIRAQILALEKPGLFILLADMIEKMRWDESINVPMSKIFLLTWKTALVMFGGLSEVEKAKDSFADKTLELADSRGQPIITASPLDYHLFRQEITSKYPAYNPPPPLFPLEPENNSILPPLKNHPNKAAGNHVFGSGLGDMNGSNTSIFQQPVHIATPAPSPPPSPAGPGGKGGKKQNYQTNNMFPFLYPPLDESSNKLGGKGSTDLQDVLVGRKWEGSDIPTSILEAAELFSKRMRATRAMKQLWEERVHFMKYERGWSGADGDLDFSDLSLEPKAGEAKKDPPPAGSIEERLDLVEECYVCLFPILGVSLLILL